MVDQGLLNIRFINVGVRLDLQELHDIRVFYRLFILGLRLAPLYLGGNRSLVLTGKQPLIIHGVDLSFKLADAPSGFDTFFCIKIPHGFI